MSVSSLFGVGAGPVVVAVRFFSQWLCTALNIIVYRQRPFFERKDGRAMLARCVFGILRYVRLCVCVCVRVLAACRVGWQRALTRALYAWSHSSMVLFCT